MTDEYASTETADLKDELNPLSGEADVIDSGRIEGLRSVITGAGRDGSLAMVSGGALVVMGVRSIARRRVRGVAQALVGIGLLRFGLGRRRSADDVWDPSIGEFRSAERDGESEGEDEYDGEATGETDDKGTSDDAHAAVERHDVGRQPGGDLAGDVETDEPGTSDVSFVEDEDPAERTKPDLEADVEDPRRTSDSDSDFDVDESEGVDVDVSEDAVADEPGEATGPDPEQAQPTQTDATEPERSPEEDESRLDEEPSTDGGPTAGGGDESDEERFGQDETDAEGDPEAMGGDATDDSASGDESDGKEERDGATDDTATADYEVDDEDDEEGMNGP